MLDFVCGHSLVKPDFTVSYDACISRQIICDLEPVACQGILVCPL